MSKKNKASFLPATKETQAQSPKDRFEKFVSALIRVPKKELDEKQGESKADRKAQKNSSAVL